MQLFFVGNVHAYIFLSRRFSVDILRLRHIMDKIFSLNNMALDSNLLCQ